MRPEVIFYVKKQRKLEKNFVKRKLTIFLKEKEQKDSLTNREKRALKNIDRYIKNLKKRFRKATKISI